MATLRREDGVQFIIQAYRELLEPNKPSTLKKQIRKLAESHGENVLLFKTEVNQLEAVFSHDPGFLFGETIWLHFNKPKNLIYCETLPERQTALVIIVKNGNVYLDTKISYANLIDEFASLVTEENKYDIYTYGDIPISVDEKESGKFVFTKGHVNNFTKLEAPLFPDIATEPEAQLQPLELALTSQHLGKPKFVPIAFAALIVLAIGIIWHIIESPPQIPIPKIKTQQAIPYTHYYTAMRTPSPLQQINEFVGVTEKMYNLPGWEVKTINLQNNSYSINVSQMGGQLTQLQQWAADNNLHVNIKADSGIINIPSKLINRNKPEHIYKLQRVIAVTADKINDILPDKSVSIGAAKTYQYTKQTFMTIRFANIAPDILKLIGHTLQGLPIKLTSIKTSVNFGLLSGTIQLAVWGN